MEVFLEVLMAEQTRKTAMLERNVLTERKRDKEQDITICVYFCIHGKCLLYITGDLT